MGKPQVRLGIELMPGYLSGLERKSCTTVITKCSIIAGLYYYITSKLAAIATKI